jgi:ubiquinone/menaquinone biosynthesis C-methylase UbiE
MKNTANDWKFWEKASAYGDVLYKRAIGELEEMESAKALAKTISNYYRPGMKILDVGCGPGHYLRSLRLRVDKHIDYTGVDATKYYIQLAKKAFGKKPGFFVGDILNLKFKDNAFDMVTCNNVILHLPPPPTKAISELLRVSKKFVVIRTVFGERNYIIKEVRSQDEEIKNRLKNEGDLIKKNGDPTRFNFFNLYTTDYLNNIIKKIGHDIKIKIFDDNDWVAFDNRRVSGVSGRTATRVVDGKQVSGNIILDWKFIVLEKK